MRLLAISCWAVFLINGCSGMLGSSTPRETIVSSSQSMQMVRIGDGVLVDLPNGEVSVAGRVALADGWLEVIACIAGTREHEAVVVTSATPSVIHAGLLLAGAKPGRPGGYDRETQKPIPPSGDSIDVFLNWVDLDTGSQRQCEITEVLDSVTQVGTLEYVFAGSRIAANPPSLGPGEHYVADYAGTVVGLATFGDELVAAREVRSPEEAIDPPAWKIRPGVLPPEGTEVQLVLRLRR